MQAYLFYSGGDGTQGRIQALADELTSRKIAYDSLDVDTPDGGRIAELYDITQRPSAVVVRDDGAMVHRWLGVLPEAGDISYYVNAL